MPRYVWTTTCHWNDGPDGGEDLGIFTSKRKAKEAARESADLPKGSRRLKWEDDSDHKDGTFLLATLSTEVGVTVYDEPIVEEVRYYVQRRVVQ